LSEHVCLLNMIKRNYKKTRRAEQQDQTRERIVKATVALHEEIGPANTSIKAVAEKAGVQRLTVYRHFPDEVSLFQACTSHWLGLNPPPGISDWNEIAEADKRSYAGLLAFYRYYRRTETMWVGAYRDVDEIAALQIPMGNLEVYIGQVRDDLLACWKVTGKRKRQLSTTLRHCLRFTTWRSLKSEDLSDAQIADLVMGWVNK
jgi:AcrR family transcriptional regulator